MTEAESKLSSMRTVGSFLNKRACSDTLFHVINKAFDHPLIPEEKAIVPLAGGIMQHGYQCGMIWGSTLAAGAEAYRRYGAGPKAETMAIRAAEKLVDVFQTKYNNINCYEITHIDKSSTTMQMITYFLIKGGTIGCLKMAAQFAKTAFREISTAFNDGQATIPSAPVSCSSLLADKMGADDQHKTMAAGYAGGIGLCGGACGALGTAIWITGMKMSEGKESKNLWGDKEFQSKAEEVIEKFLKASDYEFECEKIVGRKFKDTADHASYLQNGGCSKIIEVLAQ